MEAIAKEGALKIKEMAYIHAEGCNASSLKHGPFGLLTKGFPVILNDTAGIRTTKSEVENIGIKKALQRANLTIDKIDIVEINEAFAAQVLSCLKGLGQSFDDSRVNMNGGAIALGHPLGASGPRIFLTAARQLEKTGGKYALATLCVGVGQGTAVVMERVED